MKDAKPYAATLLGLAAALAALFFFARDMVVPEDFALRPEDHRTYEEADGLRFTAGSTQAMRAVLDQDRLKGNNLILWLGNSQLHTINQYKDGDHLSPYWLREYALPDRRIIPLGFSLPNANFQEQLVITRYTLAKVKPKLILLQLVFDDLREDDLRADFSVLLTPEVRARMQATEMGRSIVSRLDSAEISGKRGAESNGLEGFVQKAVEDFLTDRLTETSTLWAKRPNLRVKVLIDLYLARNVIFGIKATTVRKLIPLRYERNMKALEAILADARAASIPVLGYIAPLRPDVPPPYDAKEYAAWKKEVARVCEGYGARVVDLDGLVPGPEWGTYSGDEVDFMHFKGPGHAMVSRALRPLVVNLTK